MTREWPSPPTDSGLSVSEHSLKRIATALELIVNQSAQQMALMAELAASARILVDAVEQAAGWSQDNEEN